MPIATWLYRLAFEEYVLQNRLNALRRTLQAFQGAFVPRTGKRTETTTCVQTGGQRAIREGLQALSAKAKILLLLREVAHQPLSELAQITGCDVNEIRKQLLKARRDLSLALQQMESRRV
jgi:DNA-directed RNA polymerase specialized sigma24 family protein